MKKIVYSQMVSIDGFIEGPNGELDWSAPSDELHQHFNDLYLNGEIDTSIYGRKLYQAMVVWPELGNEPSATEIEKEFSEIWKKMRKIVFSKTLEKVEWNSQLVREIDSDEIKKLKQKQGGNIDIGGANLAASFIKLGLIDEYRLYIHPVILGGGKPMLPPNEKIKLKFQESQTFNCGVVMLRYYSE